jgi:hypothetical protein
LGCTDRCRRAARLVIFLVIRAWRMTALKSPADTDGLLRVRGIGGLGGLIRNSRSSSLLGTVDQFPHCCVRFAHHALPGGRHKSNVPITRPRHALRHRFARRLRDAGQECLDQRVYDCKQRLLASAHPQDVA